MKCTAILFCIAATAAVAKAASISGEANLDKNSAGAQGRIVFPRIPGINAPLSSLFPSLNNNARNGNRSGSTPSNSRSSPLGNIASLFDIPDPASLIPSLPSPPANGNSTDAEVPEIPGLPDLSNLPKIPGLEDALQAARDKVQAKLEVGSDIASGIQQAIVEAFDSNDPVAAIRTIVKTVLDAYLAVAANCPLMVVGSRVIQEGIRLAVEAAKSARNVIFGTNSTAV